MKFLFTIQGEGRGHFTQALSLASILRKNGHEVVAALIGKSDARDVPTFFSEKINTPCFTFESPNFTSFYQKKRPSIFLSVLENAARPFIFHKSILFVKEKIEELKPDVVINFYEIITGMAYGYYKFDKKLGIKMIALGHQYILLHPNYKTTKEQDVKFYFLRMLSKGIAHRASKVLALSFRDIPTAPKSKVIAVPPLLRQEVFEHTRVKGDYIHGYMLNTGYFEEVLRWHKKNPETALHFFWDKKDAEDVTKIDDNFILYYLNDKLFLEKMAGSMAYSTTAGFESVCEALYYQKPILMIPVHVEQEFNAYDASLSGAGISDKKFNLDKLLDFIPNYAPDEGFREWVHQAEERLMKEIMSL